jgi:hypothetical protein
VQRPYEARLRCFPYHDGFGANDRAGSVPPMDLVLLDEPKLLVHRNAVWRRRQDAGQMVEEGLLQEEAAYLRSDAAAVKERVDNDAGEDCPVLECIHLIGHVTH